MKFPIDLIHGIVEYTPGNKRELSAKEISEWKIILDRANRLGCRPIQNSTKRAVKASYKFSDPKGKTLLELDQFEDGIVSNADKYFLWE